MLEVDIPGREPLRLSFLVCDYNGTLARDGALIPEVSPLIQSLSAVLEVHVVTADTFGVAQENLRKLPVHLEILPAGDQDRRKAEYLHALGAQSSAALGNGRNDLLLLKDAALGICVMEAEGICSETMQAADVVCRSAVDALNLLLNPKRLTATLRR